MENKEKVLEVKDLRISFRTLSGTVKAVRGISFDLYKGRTLAIVGESGSGKSVTSRAILGILANNKIVEGGQILYDGKDLLQISEDQFTSIRGSKISMIFQDPLSSLNPIMKVGKQLTEPMFLKAKTTRKEAKAKYSDYLKALKTYFKEKSLSSAEILKVLKEYQGLVPSQNELLKVEEKINKLKEIEANNPSKIDQIEFELQKLSETTKSLTDRVVSFSNNFDAYFEKEENLSFLKEIIDEAHKKYISNIEILKGMIINFRNKHFDTSVNYREEIENLNEQIENLTNERLEKIAAEPQRKVEINQEYVAKIEELRSKLLSVINLDINEARKDLTVILKFTNTAQFEFGTEKDDIVDVYAVSLLNYLDAYNDSIKLGNEDYKFRDKYNDYDLGVKYEIPASIRAKRREIIVPFYAFYETMIEKTDSIIEYIDKNILSKEFDANLYVVEFIKDLMRQSDLANGKVTKKDAKTRALKLLKEVGIPEPERRYNQYPFEFSGGMRQRIVIAIALSSNPEILICDEPTTALDVTIQAQILELINNMKKDHNLSVIFITHDLGVVANMADDIAVMYAGKIVEYGSVYDIFYDPRHPYTWALLGSMPDLNTKGKLDAIPGTPPNMLIPPIGDAFAPRNKFAMKVDFKVAPPFFKVSDTHFAATWLLDENAPEVEAPTIVKERIKNTLKENPVNIPEFTNDKNSVLKEVKR